MKIKLDENLGRSARQLLRRAGYDVDRVTEEGLSGSPDGLVQQRATAEQRLLITLDKDFGDVRQFPPDSHSGILVLRPKVPGPRPVLAILERLVGEGPLNRFANTLSVADQGKTRVRSR